MRNRSLLIIQIQQENLFKCYSSIKSFLGFSSDDKFLSFLLDAAKPVVSYVKKSKVKQIDCLDEDVLPDGPENEHSGSTNLNRGHNDSHKNITKEVSWSDCKLDKQSITDRKCVERGTQSDSQGGGGETHTNWTRECGGSTATEIPTWSNSPKLSPAKEVHAKNQPNSQKESASDHVGNPLEPLKLSLEHPSSQPAQNYSNCSHLSEDDSRPSQTRSENFSKLIQTKISLATPVASSSSQYTYRELHPAPWRSDNDDSQRKVKRARVVEVVVKDEPNDSEGCPQYFMPNLSCGICNHPSIFSEQMDASIAPFRELPTRSSLMEWSHVRNIKKRSARIIPRMRAVQKVDSPPPLPIKVLNSHQISHERASALIQRNEPRSSSEVTNTIPSNNLQSTLQRCAKSSVSAEILELLVCPACKKEFSDETTLDEHMKVHSNHRVKRNKYEITNAHAKLEASSSALTATKMVVDIQKGRQNKPGHQLMNLRKQPISSSFTTPATPYRCLMCPFTAVESETFWCHLLSHKSIKPGKCFFCSDFSLDLKDHIKQVHCLVQCLVCHEDVSKTSLHHLKYHSLRNGNQCTICKKVYKDPLYLSTHILKVHFKETEVLDPRCLQSENGRYKCFECGKELNSIFSLTCHRHKRFACTQKIGTDNDLKMDASKEEKTNKPHAEKKKPTKFNVNGRKFKKVNVDRRKSKRLNIDEQEHSELLSKRLDVIDANLHCSGCKMHFNSRTLLWDHLKSSCKWNTVPSICCFCPKPVNGKTELLEHIQSSHLMRKCESCRTLIPNLDKKFHIKKAHQASLRCLTCFSCGKTFPSRQKLNAHVLTNHLPLTDKLDTITVSFRDGRGKVVSGCVECDLTFEYPIGLIIHRRDIHNNSEEHDKGSSLTMSN